MYTWKQYEAIKVRDTSEGYKMRQKGRCTSQKRGRKKCLFHCSIESVRGYAMIPDHMIPSAQRASLDPHPYG